MDEKEKRLYRLRGGVDVNMDHTMLDPDFALDVESEKLSDDEKDALWGRFDLAAYRRKILGLAVPLLKEQLRKLPPELDATLLPESVCVFSPHDYSYGGDELFFTIEARSDLPEKDMQALLDRTVQEDWQAEFGSQYRIYERLTENDSIFDFLKPEGGAST